MAYGARQGLCSAGAFNAKFSHMADVKNTGMFPGVEMFRKNALVLNGHEPARKGGHFRSLGFMPGGQRGTQV